MKVAKLPHSGQTGEFTGRENPDMLYRDVIKEQGTLMLLGVDSVLG